MSRKRRIKPEDGSMNMTPMIDVVFQMIIFFVTTADLDRKSFDEKIRLAMSPHGPTVEQRDPRTITIEVTEKGKIELGRVFIGPKILLKILRKAVAEYGQSTPVVIRGDGNTKHGEIRKVMDICTAAGLWKIKFSATKEKNEEG